MGKNKKKKTPEKKATAGVPEAREQPTSTVSEPADAEREFQQLEEEVSQLGLNQEQTGSSESDSRLVSGKQSQDAKVADSEKQKSPRAAVVQVGSSMEASSSKCELKIPKRGGPGQTGKEGRPMPVHVNHFPLKIHGNKKVHHYDVEIAAPWRRPNRKSDEPLFRAALLKLREDHGKIFPPVMAFDGVANLYTTQQLAFPGGHHWTAEVEVKDPEGRDTKLKLTISLVKKNIDLKGTIERILSGEIEMNLGLAEVQILNIVLSQSARESCQVIGRNYFPESSMPGRSVDLPGGKSVWFGHFQSVNIGWKPFINVDVANKPAVKQNGLIDFMGLVLSSFRYRWDPQEKWDERRFADILQKELKGLKIRYTRPDGQKREWRCNKVMAPARQLKFEIEENNRKKKISVEEYFSQHMKYKLKYPNLPCLHLGSLQKQIYIPVELCELKAQALPTNKKLNEEETADMIKKTAVTPRDRKARIEESLADISNTFQSDKYAQEFGITVESCMSKVSARVYDPPSLAYQDLKTKKPFKFDIPSPGGKWDMKRPTMRGTRPSFLDNKHLHNWAVLDLADTEPRAVTKFVDSLYNEGNSIGYNVEFPLNGQFAADPRNLDQVLREFRRLCGILKESPQSDPMILVITRGKNSVLYNGLKHEGDVLQKISTQVIQQKNVLNIKPATLHNILLKINSKLGGTNQTLHSSNSPHILSQPVMIMGADVTHAAPDQKGIKPSIAAVVASMDPKASQYECEIRIQDSSQNEEMIHGMEEITEKLIRAFLKRNNGKFRPARIIFYRDGVSEGQFLTVLNIELVAIRRACARIDPAWQPPITYIVAQKRHKTRLFPVNPRDSVGRNQNVPPGTVVDHTITHPNEFSFFLASHEGIQGTSKPTNYHLLWDDWPMQAGYQDSLIKMTYYLCHVYARCERSVSYPAPTYYAHLAAFRARAHHDAIIHSGEDSQSNRDKLQSQVGLHNYFM